jgi:type IV pilus assembly protein PilB
MYPETAVAIIDALLEEAHTLGASDLHIDPGAISLIARFRVDGTLHDAHDLPKRLQNEILARLKILAGMRIDEHNSPQDGRFTFEAPPEIFIDVRVSIAPTYYGENAVLRLLFASRAQSSLQTLGISAANEKILQRALSKTHGMIIVTGPTGSGKTSTLYALLNLLNTREISIVTIEDPIEYALEGINQISASSQNGISFAQCLRSVLRQDPNVIGIGEIRDNETASLAINAALTGHSVLSTLHTTDAATAIPRLIDMKVEPYLLSSTVSLVVSQRLLKRLCQACKKPTEIRKDQESLLALLPNKLSGDFTERFAEQFPEQIMAYESKGCERCKYSGTVGREGVFEIMQMNTELREAVRSTASRHDLRTLAIEHGMTSLLHEGIAKAHAGLVRLDEVLSLHSE